MRKVVGILVCLVLLSCGTGPVQVAKNESEAFKTSYDDPDLARVYKMNVAALEEIYHRYRSAGVDFYFDGIAVTGMKNPKGGMSHFAAIKIRPPQLVFDRLASEPENWQMRFDRIVQQEFPRYLKYLKKSDLKLQDIEGFAFGIYWPLRDYTQCNTYGGCIEYAIVYLYNQDVADIIDGTKSFVAIAKDREIVASFNLQPAKSMKVRQ